MSTDRRKQAFHYVTADGQPTKFFHEKGPVAASAARAFSQWAQADVVLWPTDKRGVYRAEWFDERVESFRTTTLTVIEEASLARDRPHDRV
jgi:hypothetical protein